MMKCFIITIILLLFLSLTLKVNSQQKVTILDTNWSSFYNPDTLKYYDKRYFKTEFILGVNSGCRWWNGKQWTDFDSSMGKRSFNTVELDSNNSGTILLYMGIATNLPFIAFKLSKKLEEGDTLYFKIYYGPRYYFPDDYEKPGYGIFTSKRADKIKHMMYYDKRIRNRYAPLGFKTFYKIFNINKSFYNVVKELPEYKNWQEFELEYIVQQEQKGHCWLIITDYTMKRSDMGFINPLQSSSGLLEYINKSETNNTKKIDKKNDINLSFDSIEKFNLDNLIFNSNDTVPTNFNSLLLDSLGSYINSNSIKIEIHGYTDNIGSYQYNKELSLKRAKWVMNYLISNGVSGNSIICYGHGEENPLKSNTNEEYRMLNRRVEIVIIKE